MNECRLKYRKQGLDLFAGIVFCACAILHMMIAIFIIVNFPSPRVILLISLLLLITILYGFQSRLYFNMYLGKRDYVTIEGGILSKDQGLIRLPKEFALDKVQYAAKVGSRIRLQVSENRELTINLNCLGIQDIGLLDSTLEKYIDNYIR